MSRSVRCVSLTVCAVMVAVAGAAGNEEERLQNAGVVLEEVLDVPDNIPQELLEKAERDRHPVDDEGGIGRRR